MIPKHILSTSQFDLPFIAEFYKQYRSIKKQWLDPKKRASLRHVLDGEIVGSYFWQPSTRTHDSFLKAALRLGASVLDERGIPELDGNGRPTGRYRLVFSSESKKERFSDSIITWAMHKFAIVLRHYEEGYVSKAARILDARGCPTHVYNGGDGPGEHPTQALIDLVTLLDFLNLCPDPYRRIDCDLDFQFAGDGKFGRTAHSLAPLLGIVFDCPRINFAAPSKWQYPLKRLSQLEELGVRYSFTETPVQSKIVYVMRINADDYNDSSSQYPREFVVDQQALEKFGWEYVMHPFPRWDEIPEWDVDDPSTHVVSIDMLPQAGYFAQMENGVPVRKTLFYMHANEE
ncbi:MAG: aspartate carbamoyltransferase catalytic subunit [Parcubacteria group bacterium Gr01-1014_70]|nr:MAG: aspartate carbamoyltransferase catalytic subunit [Parcubacteria group bacterium Gr01-1014_70]